jgi:hypothetical protein
MGCSLSTERDEALYLLFELDDYHEETLEGSHSYKIFQFRMTTIELLQRIY